MTSQERTKKLVRKAIENLMMTGFTQEQAIKYLNKDLMKHGSTITPSFVHWAVTGKYL